MRNKLSLFLLTLIFVFGTYLRFDKLGSYPIALNWDEASHGYNAFSLIKTQRDEWGIKLPLIFRAFGDYKLPSYIYLSTIPVYIFGLSAFSVRFISALSGSLAVIGIYLLTNLLISKHDNKKSSFDFGLISAFFLATTPWHFFISRAALEANLSLTLIIFGLYFLLIKSHKLNNLGLLLLGVSLQTYNTARVFVPVLLFLLIVFNRSVLPSFKKLVPGLLILSISLSIVVIQVVNGTGLARYDKLSILNPSSIYQIGQQRLNSLLPGVLPRLVYNKPVYWLSSVTKNYLSYFSPPFIYQTNQPQSQFAIPGKPLVTEITLLLFILSLLGIIELTINSSTRVLILSLLASPLAASLTASPPQAIRPNPMIISIIILSVIGLKKALSSFGRQSWLILSTCIILQICLFFVYQKDYFDSYSHSYASSWQYGYQRAFELVDQYRQPDQRLFVSKYLGEPHIFYAFYNQVDPRLLFPGNDNIRFLQTGWFWTDKVGEVYFVNDWQIPNGYPAPQLKLESGSLISTNGSLLVTSPDHLPSNFEVLDRVVYPNGNTVFVIARSK